MSSIKRLLDGDACHFFFDEQGHPWIRAADVCRKLGITNVGRALSRLKDSHKHHIITNDIAGKPHRVQYISPQGMYKLALTSRKPEAEAFTDWIADVIYEATILPDICDVLGLTNVTMAMRSLGDDEKKLITLSRVLRRGPKEVWPINGPGLLRLVMRSDKLIAKPFQWWVYHEAIPAALHAQEQTWELIQNVLSPIVRRDDQQDQLEFFNEIYRVYGWRIPTDKQHHPALRGVLWR